MGRGPFALHALTLSVALFVGAGGVMVHARQPRADAPNMQAPLLTGQIGSVDIERVYVASGGPEQLAQRATEIATEVAQRFNEVKGVGQLDQNELSEYGTLLFRAVRSEADQARLKALKAISDQRADELNRLQIKPDGMLTPEDKTRMRQLQDQNRQFLALLPNWQDDLRAQQGERVEAFRRTQMARLRPVIGKLAVERGIAHVFDSTALVYSANDLTPAVLQRVSKRPPRDKDAKETQDTKETKEKDPAKESNP